MKAIVIGVSTSGKSTIIKHLRPITQANILEIDDELERLNGGEYPKDLEYKDKILVPKIIEDILKREEIIFFTNPNYFTIQDLQFAREKGFKVIQLHLELDQMRIRNQYRVQYQGYDDLSIWFEGMIAYQEDILKRGLVDHVVNTNQPIEKVVTELRSALI